MGAPHDPSFNQTELHEKQTMATHQDRKPATTDADVAEKVVSATQSESSLPPVDGGLQAWLFLAGCYMMELLLFGTYNDQVSSLYYQPVC